MNQWPSIFLQTLRLLLFGLLVSVADLRCESVVNECVQREWRQKDGLPGNQVTALFQSSDGYVWVATGNGLARFDGTNFEPYRLDPSEKAITGAFAAIIESPTRGVVVAPDSGGLLQLKQGSFRRYPLPEKYENAKVSSLFCSNDDALWIGLDGGVVLRDYAGDRQVFGIADQLDPKCKTFFASDGSGRVWLTNGALLARYEAGHLVRLAVNKSGPELRIASSRKDGPWVVTQTMILKVRDGQPVEVREISPAIGASCLQALLEDAAGALWLGTRSRGLRRFFDNDIRLVVRTPEDFNALIEDHDGNIWAGANGGGLLRVSPGILRCYDKTMGLQETISQSVCEDSEGIFWMANRDSGVAYLIGGRVRFPPESRKWAPFVVNSIAPKLQGGIWVFSSHGLLAASFRNGVHWTTLGTDPALKTVRVSYASRNGDLWMGLSSGKLARLRGAEWMTMGSELGYTGEEACAIAEDASGRIWVGTSDGGLFRFEDGHCVRIPLPSVDHPGALQTIHVDGSGTAWIGTREIGLLCVTEKGVTVLGEKQGIADATIAQFLADDRGCFWLGSPSGIYRLRRTELESFLHGDVARVDPVLIGVDEGTPELSCLEGSQSSAWKSSDGVLWFTTQQGVIAIDPTKVRENFSPLIARVTGVRCNAQVRPLSRPFAIGADLSKLELRYSILCLSTPERIRVRYRLEGFDPDWVEGNRENTATYPRLPPGKYRFEVAATLAGLADNRASDSFTLIVNPLWWQTLWFRGLAILLGGGLLVSAVRIWSIRRLRVKLETLERCSALERERTRIARNLHDDLGAGLTRISLLTQTTNAADSGAQMEKIYLTACELARSMDETVWAVDPKYDDLDSLANYLASYAQSFLSDAGIRCRLLMPGVFPSRTLTTNCRHQIFLCCKEALTNVAKHAQASLVSLEVSIDGNELSISITDNGRGMQSGSPLLGTAVVREGNGLANMRARMSEIGGTCTIGNAHECGTLVVFTVTLDPIQP